MSVIGESRVLGWLRGLGHRRPSLQGRAPLLTFDMVTPAIRQSWLATTVGRVWRPFDAAVAGSQSAAVVRNMAAWMSDRTPATRIALGAGMCAVAAVTHLVMLIVLERYHFPRRTALVLPALVAVAALIAAAMNVHIARAIEDKRGFGSDSQACQDDQPR
jgi:hypothetical protein